MEDKVKANALLRSVERKELIKENEILNKMIESMLLKSWQDFHEPIARKNFVRKWKAKIREEAEAKLKKLYYCNDNKELK